MRENAMSAPTMKKAASILLLTGSLFGGAAFAQTAPAATEAAAPAPKTAEQLDADQAVKDLLAAMNYKEMMTGLFQQMSKSMPAMMRQGAMQAIDANPKLDDAQKQAAKERFEQNMPALVAAMQAMYNDPAFIDEMEGMIAPLYTKYFSAAEIRQMAAFYRTPAGAKMIRVMPQIMNDSMQLSQRLIVPRMTKLLQQSMSDLNQKP
jgi:hypothetical protein